MNIILDEQDNQDFNEDGNFFLYEYDFMNVETLAVTRALGDGKKVRFILDKVKFY